MQLTVKLVQVLPVQSGEGRNGVWKKQEFIVETDGQYPKKICISAWGDKIPAQMIVGSSLTIDFDVESREFNGRWYTDVKAWKIEPAGAQNMPPVPPMETYGLEDFPPAPPTPNFDDLPF